MNKNDSTKANSESEQIKSRQKLFVIFIFLTVSIVIAAYVAGFRVRMDF